MVIFCLCSFLALGVHGVQLSQVQINLDVILSETDASFVCVCLDWWPASKCDYGWCPWGEAGILNVDLQQPSLLAALKALSEDSPVHLRIGGSLADTITYQVRGDEHCPEFEQTNTTRLGYSLDGPCLDMRRWEAIHRLCESAGCDIVFGVNALKGRKFHGCEGDPNYHDEFDCHGLQPAPACCFNFTTAWDGSNARDLFLYTAEQLSQYPPPYGFEFGNEVTGPGGIQARLSVQDYARDFKEFAKLVREAWPEHTPKIMGTDGSGFEGSKWVDEFLELARGDLDIYTWHTYFLGAGVSPDLPSKILSPTYLDQMRDLGAGVQDAIAGRAEVWMGETGGAFNSGHPGVTDAFMSGFWYLDNLATLAQMGHQAFCRQTLIGGSYGLLDTVTFEPNPDFYAALLFKRLMGRAVLNVTVIGPATLRAYAHCAQGDTSKVSLLLMNMANSTSAVVELPFSTSRDEYRLTSTSLNSRKTYLNGKSLEQAADKSIPALEAKVAMGGSMELEPLSYAFVVFSDAQAPACSSQTSVYAL